MLVRRIATSRWNYTLFESAEGSMILKVMFSEGTYKVDVARYFVIDSLALGSFDESVLTAVAESIRTNYPDTDLPEIAGSAVTETSHG